MKKYIRPVFILIGALAVTIGILYIRKTQESDVRAFGDLLVNFGVPPGNPIFTVNNMAPGEFQNKNIIVNNGGSVAHFVAIKGTRKGPAGQLDPKIESILDVIISQGGTDLYGGTSGSKTLQNFFDESNTPNGISLSTINPGQSKTYTMKVIFPSTSGNQFQNKSVVLDITFGEITGQSIVINEVFYKVDTVHGLDSAKDRNEKKKNGPNDEWIELYNPTDSDITLKNWTLTDNSGNSTIIHPNKKIKAHGFALLSKDGSVWQNWNEDSSAEKIELGQEFGDGLDNGGDHLILKNPLGQIVDQMAWQNDTSIWNPASVNVAPGHSLKRIPDGFDTNAPSDFHDQNSPSPGN